MWVSSLSLQAAGSGWAEVRQVPGCSSCFPALVAVGGQDGAWLRGRPESAPQAPGSINTRGAKPGQRPAQPQGRRGHAETTLCPSPRGRQGRGSSVPVGRGHCRARNRGMLSCLHRPPGWSGQGAVPAALPNTWLPPMLHPSTSPGAGARLWFPAARAQREGIALVGQELSRGEVSPLSRHQSPQAHDWDLPAALW